MTFIEFLGLAFSIILGFLLFAFVLGWVLPRVFWFLLLLIATGIGNLVYMVRFRAIPRRSHRQFAVDSKKMAKAQNTLASCPLSPSVVAQINAALIRAYPHLKPNKCQQVVAALQQFFAACLAAKHLPVRMPSAAVDVAWHAFILNSREYQSYCQTVFGRYLHHAPDEAQKPNPKKALRAMSTTWRFCCVYQGINPKKATTVPLLFAIDEDLKIPDGYRYTLDKHKKNTAKKNTTAVGDIGGPVCIDGDNRSDRVISVSSFVAADGSYHDSNDTSVVSVFTDIAGDIGGGSDGGGCGGGCG